jgi:hypothetical protein
MWIVSISFLFISALQDFQSSLIIKNYSLSIFVSRSVPNTYCIKQEVELVQVTNTNAENEAPTTGTTLHLTMTQTRTTQHKVEGNKRDCYYPTTRTPSKDLQPRQQLRQAEERQHDYTTPTAIDTMHQEVLPNEQITTPSDPPPWRPEPPQANCVRPQ